MKIDFFSDINKENYHVLDYDRIDKWLVKYSWWNAGLLTVYAFGIYFFAPAAIYPSPFSWRLVSFAEALTVSVLAILTAVLIAFSRGKFKNHYIYRLCMSFALVFYTYLVVLISGGSIEWHFQFFVVFAALVLYSDWRLGWWAILAVALHHGILNFVAPTWVYYYGRNDIAFLSHALLVTGMALVTTKLCENNRQLAEASRLLGEELKINL